MVNWEKVTNPKKYGGTGLRVARLSIIALLGKLVWNLLYNGNKLWVQVLSHKYMSSGSVWGRNQSSRTSTTWRSIQKATLALLGGFSFKISSGNSSLMYNDWLGKGPICNSLDFVHISDTTLRLKDA